MKRRSTSCALLLILVLVANALGVPSVSTAAPAAQKASPPDLSFELHGQSLVIQVSDAGAQQPRAVAKVDLEVAHPLFEDFASLSPDQRQVLYVTAHGAGLADAEFWVAANDGSGSTRIAQFPQGLWSAAPLWSPDGKRIAYVMKDPDSTPEAGLQLWVMNPDGSNQQLVTQNGDFRPALFDRIPQGVLSWRADSASLEFRDRWSAKSALYTVAVADGWITKSEILKDPTLAEVEPIAQSAGVTALPCAVPTFRQADYGNNMRTCNQTISAAGCALTSSAMVLKYYGVRTDPPTLNACLGDRACPLNWWPVASSCSENKVSGVAFLQGFSYSTIDQDLANGKPVIVWLSTRGTHFVVVTGGSGSRPSGYTINDPADGSSNKTLESYTSRGWTLSAIDRFSGTPACSDNDGGDISYGQSKNGTINPAGDTDDFYFNASGGDVVEIRQNKNGSSLDSYVRLYNPSGTLIAYNDDSGGNRNAFIRHTIGSSGRYRIRVMAWGSSTGAYTLSLTRTGSSGGGCTRDCQGENRWISFGQTLNETINPANDRDTYYFSGTAGRVVSIRMNRTGGNLDSFLELWNPNNVRVAANDDGGGNRNSWLVYTLPSSGTYRISAYSYNNATTGSYSIKLESITGGGGSGNLARGKPVAVSSVEFAGVEGWKATDGSTGTRWSSRFSDPQWIFVDLGQNRNFNQVVLKWEAAYGRSFGIYYQSTSMCSNCWNNVYWTNSGRGGTNTINFGRVSARYVLMYGTARGTPWGYSLWEFEVYDTSTTTVPIVPPDDPEKGENTAPLEAPLPPTEGDKDVMLSGDGEYGQEETPLASGEPGEVTQDLGAPQTVVAHINSPDESGLYKLSAPEGFIQFQGEASSQDGSAITTYHWRSDRQGEIGAQAEFILPVTALWPGRHTIYFKAQNELGVWSEEDSVTLDVEWSHRVLLPMIPR